MYIYVQLYITITLNTRFIMQKQKSIFSWQCVCSWNKLNHVYNIINILRMQIPKGRAFYHTHNTSRIWLK